MRRKETNESLRNLAQQALDTKDWSLVEDADVSEVTDMSNLFNGINGIVIKIP